ncbi:MAG: tRNA lysidine(34) synthetase TilS [Candidatus Binatia bacterium]
MAIEQDLRNLAIRQRLLSGGDRVLVAVSGGPDSVALLHLLCELRDQFALHLEVAHLQHGIRGEESKEDATFVAALAESLELPFHLKGIDLPQMKSDAGKGNLEALGRVERYRFFAEVVKDRGLGKVATAHTRDDQAETVMMWFLRGAGKKGSAGMSPLQQLRLANGSPDTLTVIRPLLETSKSEILAYLAEKGLAYRIDLSNQDSAFLRNWIRLELMPKIHERVDDGLSSRLGQQAQLFRDEDLFLEEMARKCQDRIHDGIGLRRTALLGEPKALQRRVLRLWLEQKRGHLRGIDFVHIETLLRLIEEGPAQGRLSIPGGWELVREYEKLRLERRSRGWKSICYNYRLEVGTRLRIDEASIELQSELAAKTQLQLEFGLMEAAFDASCLTGHLAVRNFRRGDRFQPLGMAGHKKIKDLFIEKKVPLSIRARCPLLTMDEEILWIPGFGRSEIARVSEKTAACICMKAVPIET